MKGQLQWGWDKDIVRYKAELYVKNGHQYLQSIDYFLF